MAKQNVAVQLFHSGDWHEVPAYTSAPIGLSRGASSEGQQAPPSSASLVLDDRTGANNPLNPTSPLYGLVGRNTPMRVVYDVVREDFEDTGMNVAISGTWARSTAQAHTGTWSLKSAAISDEETTDAVVTVPAGATTLSFWYYVSSEEDFDLFQLLIDGIDGGLEASGEVGWTRHEVGVGGASTVTFRYVKDESVSEGDDAAWIDDLMFCRVVSCTEVASWAPQRTVSGAAAATPVTGGGLLRRIRQGDLPLQSAMYRALSTIDPAPAYWWDLEVGDGRAITSVPSALAGGPALVASPASAGGDEDHRLSGVVGGSVVGPYGGSVALDMSGGGQLSTTELSTSSTGPLRIEVAVQFTEPVGEFDSGQVLRIRMDATIIGVFAGVTPGAELAIELADDDSFDSDSASYFLDDGAWHHVRLDLAPSGGDTTYDLSIDGVSLISGTATGVPFGPVDELVLSPTGDIDAAAHLAVWDGAFPSDALTVDAFDGYYGETAGARFLRLCFEEGVDGAVYLGEDLDLDDTPAMGPQGARKLTDLLDECVQADDGLLVDERDELELVFRAGRTRYNQDPALTIDFDGRYVAPGVAPVLDDRHTRNDVTAKRSWDGHTARAVQSTGPLNFNNPIDDPEGVGRYDTAVTVNVSADVELLDIASWHLAKGTIAGARYPSITLDLDQMATHAPELVPLVDELRIGDVIQVDNLPAEWHPGPLRLLVLGQREQIGSHRRLVTLNCMPASVFEIGIVGANDGSTDLRDQAVGTDLSTLTSGVTAYATSLSVTTSSGVWTTDADDWSTSLNGGGLFIEIGGEQMRVTNITGASSPQTFTVVRSTNGVVKAHAAGAAVAVAHPIRVGL